MEREKLLGEYRATLTSLVEKTKFVYSKEFYALDGFDKQKYNKDKMATEAHLGTLCNILWGEKIPSMGGLSDMFALGLLGSMFNYGGGFGTTGSTDYLKKELENISEVKEDNAE